jgi:predicted CXXCH cytochrome family protein
MKMFNSISTVIIGAALALASTTASAAVLGTKHDLSAGSGNNAFTAATAAGTPATASDQVCVFCHTPHAAASAANQIIPLWNRTTTASAFTLYQDNGAGTLDGAVADGAIGGVSLACLSCHDGSIALASVLNTPGSGGNADTDWAAGTWSNAGSLITAGKLDSTGVAGLGSDLTNDHPVGIQYAGGGLTITTGSIAGTAKDGAFIAPTIGATSTQAWVGAIGTGIPLFTNELVAGNGINEPFVECASCHNPHGTTNDMFLRAAATNSTICTSCHVK